MGRKVENLAGQRFGRLLVIELAESGKRVKWRCKCDCGATKDVRRDALINGATTSCGCYARERSTTHGMRGTRIYNKWIGMRQRCNDTNYHGYANYGGRGIKVCERWDSFENFFEDMGFPPTETHQPDRIDNDGDYEPENVRWATPTENASNRRDSAIIEFEGRRQTVRQWARELGISHSTLQYRLANGWSVQKSLTQTVHKGKGWRKGHKQNE